MYLQYKQEHKPTRKVKIPPLDQKKKKVPLSKLSYEQLADRLEYLEIENVYLKKLKALVQEKLQRESGKR